MNEPRHRLSVLVVDDSPDAAGSTAELLALCGHDARVAGSGAAALAAAATDPPDVVLLDLGLPDMDGWEVAARLRGRPGKPPVMVAVTGFGAEGDRRRSADAGVDLHLVKPAVLVGVLRRFERVLAPARPIAWSPS